MSAASDPTEPGPGRRLILARRRVQAAVLVIQHTGVAYETYAGSEKAAGDYAELSDAARELVLAQNACEDYAEARRERHNLPEGKP